MSGYHQASKLSHFRATVRANGGLFRTLYKLWRFDTFKHGSLKGWDSNGNKYYENQRYMIGRSRWVEYADHYKWDYDATQVTPEWFGWLHYMTDQVPCCNSIKCCMSASECHALWLLPPEENMTNTQRAYYPYSTTRANVVAWDDNNNARKCGMRDSWASRYDPYVDRIKETGSCYWAPLNFKDYGKFKKDFWNAKKQCEDAYADLVVFDDENERRIVMDILQENYDKYVGYTEFIYIGVAKINNAWIVYEGGYTTPLDEVGYAPWGPGQPDNARSNENCVAIHKLHEGEMHDVQCGDYLNFVCEKHVDSVLLKYT